MKVGNSFRAYPVGNGVGLVRPPRRPAFAVNRELPVEKCTLWTISDEFELKSAEMRYARFAQ